MKGTEDSQERLGREGIASEGQRGSEGARDGAANPEPNARRPVHSRLATRVHEERERREAEGATRAAGAGKPDYVAVDCVTKAQGRLFYSGATAAELMPRFPAAAAAAAEHQTAKHQRTFHSD